MIDQRISSDWLKPAHRLSLARVKHGGLTQRWNDKDLHEIRHRVMLHEPVSRFAAARRVKQRRRRQRVAYQKRFTRPRMEMLEKRLLLAQDLLITNPEADNILRFDGETGDPLGEFVTSGSGGLVDPIDPTFGPDGNLYVISSDSGNEKILRYHGDDGSFIDTFVDTGQGGFDGASAIDFGPDGDLYVATNTSDGVLRFDGTTGAFETAIAAGEVARASGLAFGHDNNLYVMDSDGFLNTFADRITRYDPATGNLIDEFVAPGNLEDVAYFTFGPDGHIYVPDVSTNDIVRFNGTTGAFNGVFVDSVASNAPFQVVFGQDGDAYLSGTDIRSYDGESGTPTNFHIEENSGTFTFFPPSGVSSDLEVTDVIISRGAIQGIDVSLTFTVRNNSVNPTSADSWEDVVFLSTDDVFDPLDQELGRLPRSGVLGGDESYTNTLNAMLPNIALEEFHVIVVTDRQGKVWDANPLNNRLVSTDTLEVFPALASNHDPNAAIAVGRQLSAYTTADVEDSLTVTYAVHNLTDGYANDVVFETSLATGVSLSNTSDVHQDSAGNLSWHLGLIPPFSRATVEIVVSLSDPTVTQIDVGPTAYATIDGVVVKDELAAAILRTDEINPVLLSVTPDADWTDPFIQAKAASLDQDPVAITSFVADEIAYESYLGSLRGARGTLWSGAGNSLDQASLLGGSVASLWNPGAIRTR